MAKIIILNSVFDINDYTEYEHEGNISIKDFLYSIDADKKDYTDFVEVYDPETQETSYIEMADDTESLNIAVSVNDSTVDIDYIIKDSDRVFISILPANKDVGMGLGIAGGLAMLAGALTLTIFGGPLNPLANVIGWTLLGIGATCLVVGGIIAALDGGDTNSKKINSDDNAEKNPEIAGSKNQSLIGQAYPTVIGSVNATPFVVGSTYTELNIDENDTSTWFGRAKKAFLLLAIGHAPLLIKDITLGNLPFVSNPNNVLSGKLYSSYDTQTGELLDENGNPVHFNNVASEREIGTTWLSNKPTAEISQFGLHRTIYPYAVQQEEIKDGKLLYCYDQQYREIAEEKNLITWRGGKFPTGLRTQSIHFSSSVPYKLAVGINFPAGLYRSHNNDSGDTVYDKIPMNLVVQWRPVYKYTYEKDYDNKWVGPEATYDKERDGYSLKRYGYWRDFDDSKIIAKETYYSNATQYISYSENGVPYTTKNGNMEYFCHYLSTTGYGVSDEMIMDTPRYTYEQAYKELYKFAKSYSDIGLSMGDKNAKIVVNGVVCTYSAEHAFWAFFNAEVFQWKDPARWARENAQKVVAEQDASFVASHPNFIKSLPAETDVIDSAREVELNSGLSKGTQTASNPIWNGIKCFPFGKFSGGENMYDYNPSNPSKTSGTIGKANLEGAKDQMEFELTATLDQEDILDLLGKNPASRQFEIEHPEIKDGVEPQIDSVEVRVIRLTPCYIDGKYPEGRSTDNKTDYSYADVVEWNYLKSYVIDKNKLLDDINYTPDGKKFAKINIDQYTYTGIDTSDPEHPVDISEEMEAEGSSFYNDWNIEDYYAKPFNDEDQETMVTLGLEVVPDLLGYISNSIDKISVVAKAISPTLLDEHIRYWYAKDGVYKYFDSYNKESTEGFKNLDSTFHYVDDEWIESSEEEFLEEDTVEIANGYYYSNKNQAWDKMFFPKKIEEKRTLEVITDANGNAILNEKGDVQFTSVKNGNDWIDYIKHEVLNDRNKDFAGRYIASQGFIEAFTDQNAISQVLGFMCGLSLGKDAYGYNSLNDIKFIRYWYVDGDNYYYINTDETVAGTAPEFDETKWEKTAKSYFSQNTTYELTDGYFWSYRIFLGSFNMLALKESYTYTNGIDIGDGSGPIQFNCNMYLYQQKKVIDTLSQILVCARAYWFYDDKGRYEIHNDKPLDNPIMLLSDENILSVSNTRSLQKSIGGYHITFNDENNAGEKGEIYVLRQGQSREKHTRDIKDLSFEGVTNNLQARSLGIYTLANAISQREAWTWKLNHIGANLTIGSLVRTQTKSLMIGTDTSGRILKFIEGFEEGDDGSIHNYIYGFLIDNEYEYIGDYNEDGTNKQGCSIMQSGLNDKNRIVTLRFANKTQQENGITVRGPNGVVTYRNVKSMTNLVLLEKKIDKDNHQLENQTEDKSTGTEVITEFNPELGDVVAFGLVGAITVDALVSSITPAEKNQYSVMFYPYNKDVYTAGASFPTYKTGITKKPLVDGVAPKNTEISTMITEAVNDSAALLSSDFGSKITDVIEGNSEDIPDPETPSVTKRKVTRDYIDLSMLSNGKGVYNSVKRYIWELSKDGGNTWSVLNKDEDDGNSASYKYYFDRAKDGYPESEELDLMWKVRAKVVSNYDKESEWTEALSVDTDDYGTWEIPSFSVSKEVQDRTVLLTLSVQEGSVKLYGDTKFKLKIKREGYNALTESGKPTFEELTDPIWTKPNLYDSPYESEDNYRVFELAQVYHASKTYYQYNEETTYYEKLDPQPTRETFESDTYYTDTEGQYEISNGKFSQTLPLFGQAVRNLYDTSYKYQIIAFNESGKESAPREISVTALLTSIADVVKANENYKSLYVEKLSAISANVGMISQGGFGDFKNVLNYWALSNLTAEEAGTKEKVLQGAFRVGGRNQYIRVNPTEKDDGSIEYAVEVKAGNILLSGVSSDTTDLTTGLGTYITNDDNPNFRLKLSAEGLYFQKRESEDSDNWSVVGKITIDKNNNMILTNAGEKVDLPQTGIKLPAGSANVYHFDSDFLDEFGANSDNLTIGGKIVNEAILEGSNALRGVFMTDYTRSRGFGILCKNAEVGINGISLCSDGENVPSTKIYVDALKNSGLTDAQLVSGIFKAGE